MSEPDRAKQRQAARDASGKAHVEGSIYEGMEASVQQHGRTIAHVPLYGDALAIAASLNGEAGDKLDICPQCGGSGVGVADTTCSRCDGSGGVSLTQQGENTPVSGDEVERVARAIHAVRFEDNDDPWDDDRDMARAAIATLHPTDPAAIRNAALEEAARVADAEAEDISATWNPTIDSWQRGRRAMAELIAAAIRGLVKGVG